MSTNLGKWEIVRSFVDRDYGIFKTVIQEAISPKDFKSYRFYTIDSSDWVNVIPLTEDGKIVMIKQFRQGRKEICLEIPGGLVEKGEDPLDCAIREVEEETGYIGGKVTYLGVISPNPALFTNLCHTFLFDGVRKEGLRKLDATEDIEVVLVDKGEIVSLIREGVINHALVICAFFFFFLKDGRF